MRAKKRGAVVATAAVAVVAVAGSAWAYFALASNTDTGGFTARSLTEALTPAGAPASSTSVTVTWSLPASQVPGAQYVVTNTVDNHTACTVASTVTSCTDTAAVPGVANTYRIAAALSGSSWTSTGTTFTTAATPPLLVIARTTSTALVAGTAFPVNVTAKKGSPLVTDASYTGNKTVAWSGFTNSPDGTAPVYPATTLAFSGGVSATVNVTTFTAGSQTLSVTSGSSSGSATYTVSAAGAALRFTSGTPSCDSGSITIDTAGATFTAKVSRDQDVYGNTASFSGLSNGPVTLSPTSKGTFSPTTVSFANNGAKESGAFTYTRSGNGNVTLTAALTGYVSGTCSAKQ
ncbi:MAG TPA: hypothetical protein VF519_11805 [Mycobacteriales bacterium]|jgi:hypothetical protein